MQTRWLVHALFLSAGISSAAPGWSQQAPSEVGKVIEIKGPVGAVIVARGSQSYALQQDDLLFDGDRIFTRSNGGVTLNANGCERTLDKAASLTINKDLCRAVPTIISLENASALETGIVAGEALAATSAVGASPQLLTALAGGGAATAAATASGASTASVVD